MTCAFAGIERALLVVAHPDDEAMFFVPTIVSLQAAGAAVHVLCLSEGNFYGLGATRRREMRACCADVLRVTRCEVLSDERLLDGAAALWPAPVVAEQIRRYVDAHRIDALVTFDERGVSGHRDHIAVHGGARRFVDARAGAVRLFTLQSVSVVRKYCTPLDLVCVWLALESGVVAAFNWQPLLVYRAMRAHASQLVWFRYIFILFSRYTLVNTLRSHTN
jgi:N-acetylglucosaminylphosphatidylinositol deacetylase